MADPVETPVRIERLADRVVATLDRPAVRNAIDRATADALHALCAELEADPRILIITGAGGGIAGGTDVERAARWRAEGAGRTVAECQSD